MKTCFTLPTSLKFMNSLISVLFNEKKKKSLKEKVQNAVEGRKRNEQLEVIIIRVLGRIGNLK